MGAGNSSVYSGFLSERRGHSDLELYKRPWFPIEEPRGKWRLLRFLVVPLRLTSDVVPLCPCTALYSRRSSRPQPMESGGDATPCKVTREDRRLYFLTCRVSLKAHSHTAFKDVPPSTQKAFKGANPHTWYTWPNPSQSDGRALRGHGNDSGLHWARSSLTGGAVRGRSVRIKGRMTKHPGHSVGEDSPSGQQPSGWKGAQSQGPAGSRPKNCTFQRYSLRMRTFLTSTSTMTRWSGYAATYERTSTSTVTCWKSHGFFTWLLLGTGPALGTMRRRLSGRTMRCASGFKVSPSVALHT